MAERDKILWKESSMIWLFNEAKPSTAPKGIHSYQKGMWLTK